jgi:hypothetical protein
MPAVSAIAAAVHVGCVFFGETSPRRQRRFAEEFGTPSVAM